MQSRYFPSHIGENVGLVTINKHKIQQKNKSEKNQQHILCGMNVLGVGYGKQLEGDVYAFVLFCFVFELSSSTLENNDLC